MHQRWPITALAGWLLFAIAYAHASNPPDCPPTTSALYARIGSVGLDPQRVYHVRGATVDRPNLHLDFDDGTIAFTEDICGRFTGMAILEEQFTSGYLRFNDDTAQVLQPFLTPQTEGVEFIKEWNDTGRALAQFDALHMLLDFSRFLPAQAGKESDPKFPALLHAHLLGKKLGAFEVFCDSEGAEPLWAGQPRVKDGVLFFDIWTSFAAGRVDAAAATVRANDVSITNYQIRASVQPPTRLQATTEVNLRIQSGGERALLFELSRYLKVDAIEADGRPLDFIQNPAIEGSQLQRKGNDLVAVVFASPLTPGQQLKLRFRYAGDVLSEAGSGLLYVGERGTWYPNFGLNPARFDMEFHYPAAWTLVATGKQVSRAANEDAEPSETAAEKVSRWTSERPLPVAGFNLGRGQGWQHLGGCLWYQKRREIVPRGQVRGHTAANLSWRAWPKNNGAHCCGSATTVARARCAGSRGQGSQSHHQILPVVWTLSLWLVGLHSDAGRPQSGLAGARISVQLCVFESTGAGRPAPGSSHARPR